MSVYSTLFSQTFFGLLFCYLTFTDVMMYLQIIDFQFSSCCTSQPKKTKPNHYCEQFYEYSYHQKSNSCTLCVPMFKNGIKGVPYLKMDQNVCLNLVKLDQLCAIAFMKREQILRVLLKMVAMATSHSLWRFYLIALTPTTPALLQNKI